MYIFQGFRHRRVPCEIKVLLKFHGASTAFCRIKEGKWSWPGTVRCMNVSRHRIGNIGFVRNLNRPSGHVYIIARESFMREKMVRRCPTEHRPMLLYTDAGRYQYYMWPRKELFGARAIFNSSMIDLLVTNGLHTAIHATQRMVSRQVTNVVCCKIVESK